VVGSCSQACLNLVGSFKCDCLPGYKKVAKPTGWCLFLDGYPFEELGSKPFPELIYLRLRTVWRYVHLVLFLDIPRNPCERFTADCGWHLTDYCMHCLLITNIILLITVLYTAFADYSWHHSTDYCIQRLLITVGIILLITVCSVRWLQFATFYWLLYVASADYS
jgi:hypothetical protein